jgi:hypothetical protein
METNINEFQITVCTKLLLRDSFPLLIIFTALTLRFVFLVSKAIFRKRRPAIKAITMSSPAAATSIEDEHARRAIMNMQSELQISEEEAFGEARRGSTTKSENGSQGSAGETVKSRKTAVHSEELQRVLGRIKYDKEGGRAALAAAMTDLREVGKEEMGVKGLKGAQKVKSDNTDRSFKQAFYDC